MSRVDFFPDGNQLISGSWDGTTKIWEVVSGRLKCTIDEDFVCLSRDGTVLATSPKRSPIIHLQSPEGGGPVRTIRVPGFFLLTGVISKDGATLAVNSSVDEGKVEIKHIYLVDIPTGKVRQTLSDNLNGGWPLLFSPQDDLVISGGHDSRGNAIRFWDSHTGKRVRQFTGHEGAVRSAAYLRDGSTVATASADGTVRLWDATTGREKRRLTGPEGTLWSMSISPDGRRLACDSSDRSVYVWQISEATLPLRISFKEFPQRVAFAPDGHTLTISPADGELRQHDPMTGKTERTLTRMPKEATALAYSPDGKNLAWSGYENDIYLIDVESGRKRQKLTGHQFWVRALAFSPRGRWLVSGGDDGSARIWDLSDTSSQVLFKAPEGREPHAVTAVAFSKDGALVASGHKDGQVRLWEASSRQRIAVLSKHLGAVNSLAFAPDGRHLVSASDDTTALIWDLSTIVSNFKPPLIPQN